MPRPTAAAPAKPTAEETLAAIRKQFESLEPFEAAELLAALREEHGDRILSAFDEAWRGLERLAADHHRLAGRGLPVPATIADVFDNPGLTPTTRGRTRPDAWYHYELTTLLRLLGEEGATEAFLGDYIAARGGDARHATRTILPALAESGFLSVDDGGAVRLANLRSDAWYDYTVLSFLNAADPAALPTTMQIHDHVIAQGGHGADVVTRVLPRLTGAGRVREVADGVWESATRRPDAWYDFAITSFVADRAADDLPTSKQIHDHVISMGGHGAAVFESALPRLAAAGHLVEVAEGVWDFARRKPAAWYDHTIMSFLHEVEEGAFATTRQIHDHVIERGGHGAEVATAALPRLALAGAVREREDGVWEASNRRPRAWYDHTVLGFIREAGPDSPPTLRQIHDHVIERGGHGAEVVTTVLPALVRAGEVLEVADGVYDVANRRTDAWYDQTVLAFVEASGGEVTTTQVYEHVIASGGHGTEAVTAALPRLARAGLLAEVEMGTWAPGSGVPLAWIESQLLGAIRGKSPQAVTTGDAADAVDTDLADETTIEAALASLEEAGLIERADEGVWKIPGASNRGRATNTAANRPRRLRRAA